MNPKISETQSIPNYDFDEYNIEKCIVASLMADMDTFKKFLWDLKPEYFEKKFCAEIITWMQENNCNDMIAIVNAKPEIIIDIADINDHATMRDISHYIDALLKNYMRRQIKLTLQQGLKDIENPEKNNYEIINQVTHSLTFTHKRNSQPELIGEILPQIFDDIEAAVLGKNIGILSGIESLDEKIGGAMPGELIIIAGRPGMGKSSFAAQMALNMALKNNKILIFSLEMSKRITTGRILFSGANLCYDEALRGLIDKEKFSKLNECCSQIHKLALYIDDTPAIIIPQILNKAEMIKGNSGLDIIFLDHIQLMGIHERARTRNEQIMELSSGLKNIARMLDIPCIALSQMSRQIEKRTEQTPVLSDLRDGGSLEQDADKILFLHRPEMYGIQDAENICEIFIAKNRNGRTGCFKMFFDKKTMSFQKLHTGLFDYPFKSNN